MRTLPPTQTPLCRGGRRGRDGEPRAQGHPGSLHLIAPGAPTPTHPTTSLLRTWRGLGRDRRKISAPRPVSTAPSPSRVLTGWAGWGAPAALHPLLGTPWPAGRVSRAGSRSRGSEVAPKPQLLEAGSRRHAAGSGGGICQDLEETGSGAGSTSAACTAEHGIARPAARPSARGRGLQAAGGPQQPGVESELSIFLHLFRPPAFLPNSRPG